MAKEPASAEEEFQYYTQKAGDIGRQLGLAGLAVVWLFHFAVADETGSPAIGLNESFKTPVILFIASLGLDALQYLLGALLWGIAFHQDSGGRAYQDKGPNIAAIVVPVYLIAVKLILMAVGYGYLLSALTDHTHWLALN